jgi:16S rRNA (uracil1498-N3)-methyltransferase
MRRFYAQKKTIDEKAVLLGEEETRHLRDVLRLKTGDEVRIFDGEGREYSGVVAKISKKDTSLNIIAEVPPASPESDLELTLAVALLKGEKFDLVIQKAVELGVTALIPLLTRRCDVKIKDGSKRHERWERIALEACKQSGRARLMKIGEIMEFNEFIVTSDSNSGILFSERGGEDFSQVKPGKKITAVIGPEGGWEDSEIDAARAEGFIITTLGGRIMRAETAAISIAAILQHRFGDLS